MRDALKRLYSLGPGRMQPGRGRLRRLLAKAGDPHLAVPAILIGGTNGKGRLVSALSAVLSRRYSTGAFLKPHLVTIRERWRINDRPVPAKAFIDAAHFSCDLIERHDEPISFFEANVLLGALLFVAAKCDVAVWEIGLGGKEDACNLVDPLVSVLTNVGYDHQAILGQSLTAIARDKAQICRPGRALLLGSPRPGWEDAFGEYAPVVAGVCAAHGAKLVQLPVTAAANWERYFNTAGAGLPPDTHDLLIATLRELKHASNGSLELGPAAVLAGLAQVNYRGRMERGELRGLPVLLDAAHNVDSLRWLTRMLKAFAAGQLLPGGTPPADAQFPVVFGCQASREPRELLEQLAPVIDTLVPVEIPVLRPCPLRRIISAAAELGIRVALPDGVLASDMPAEYTIGNTTELDPPDNRTRWIESVEYGLGLSSTRRPTVICGSIYNLGEILRVFEAQAAFDASGAR